MGYTIGRANTPSLKSLSPNVLAILLSPMRTGIMGVALLPVLNPRFSRAFLK